MAARRDDGGRGRWPRPTEASSRRRANVVNGPWILVGLDAASVVVIAVIAVLVLTGTDWGRERVRRYADKRDRRRCHGKREDRPA